MSFSDADFGEEHVLERQGCPLHYWLAGPDGAPLVAFLHGAGIDHRTWAHQVGSFAADHRVLSVDLRGHGRSRPRGDGYSFDLLVDDVIAILDAVGASTVIPIGQSMGGNVAQELLFRHPRRVNGLICLGCACNTLKLSRLEQLSTGPGLALLRAYPSKMLLRTIAKRSSILPEGQAYVYEAEELLSKKEFLDVFSSLVHALHHEPDYRVDVPELILRGNQDKLGNFRAAMPKWQARDPHSELVVIPNAGHVANQDNPEFFNRTCLEWLGRVGSAAAPGVEGAQRVSPPNLNAQPRADVTSAAVAER
jgi:3-oxoadipate enol-lactonase